MERELLEISREGRSLQLANALLNKDEKVQRKLLPEYQDLLDRQELIDESSQPYRVYENTGIAELVSDDKEASKIPIAPTTLNSLIGNGCIAGDSLLVFARPEIGKTAFAINIARGAAKRGHRILYCSNEDSATRLLLRAKASFADKSVEEILASPQEVDEVAFSGGFGNIVFVEMYPGNLRQIRGLVEEYRPNLLIVDQLINLEGSKDDNHVLHLGKLARGVRNIGKQYGLVTISFAQAGDSASNKLVLDLNDVNWSNTDIQAAADLMIGIGANEEFLRNDWRMLSLCKNKMSGKHDYIQVRIDRLKSRFYSK